MPFAEPGVEPHYAPDRTVRIEHIDLALSLFPAERSFAGKATIRFRTLPSFDGTLVLDFDEAELLSAQSESGEGLRWRNDGEQLSVMVGKEARSVVLTWKGQNSTRGLYFTGPVPSEPTRQATAWTQCQDEDAHYFIPCHDHPGVKHGWSVRLEGPVGYTLLSNGAHIESFTEGDRAVARFEQQEPMPAYLFTAVCAQLSVLNAEWRGKSVRYFAPVGEEAYLERAMGRTPEMMELFSTRTGIDFPWARYDQVVVHDFIFGGMENIGCTTMTRMLLVDDKAVLEWEPDGLVAHELAHQWFGDLVTCQDWSQGWLNESWATFMEVVWYEHSHAADDATWYRWQQAEGYFNEEGGRYRRPIVSYQFREPIDIFDRHLYEKGACVLNTLRAELGEEALWAGVREYLSRYAHRSVHSRDFQRSLEEASGRNLDRFFHQWIHSAGHPVVTVALAAEGDLLLATVTQKQSGDGVPQAFAFPLRLDLVGEDGQVQVIDLPIRERERTFAIPGAGKLRTVRVDPGARVLAAIDLKASRGWLEVLLQDSCPVLAIRAAKALMDDGSVKAVAAVVRALGVHPFHGVRGELAAMIARRGGDEARDVLIAAYRAEKDARVLKRIADALGGFRQTAVADFLIEALKSPSETWHLTGALLNALGKTRDPRAAEVITPYLATWSWGDVVAQGGLDGLSFSENAGVFDTLVACTRGDHRPRVRAAAARSIGRLGDIVESVRARAVERLCEMMIEPGYRSQLGAITGLARLRDARALRALSQVHRTAPDGRTRRLASEAMHGIRQGRTTDEGLSTLRSRLDAVEEQNQKFRRRIEKMEQVEKAVEA